jgi:hypothetical protein
MPPTPPPPPRSKRPSSEMARSVPPQPLADLTRNVSLPWLCLGLALSLLLVVICGFFWLDQTSQHPLMGDTASSPATSSETFEPIGIFPDRAEQPATVVELAATDAVAGSRARMSNRELFSEETDESESDRPKPPPFRNLPGTPPPTANPAAPSARREPPAVFADLHRRDYQLVLPGLGLVREAVETTLAALPVATDQPLQLALQGETESGIKLVAREPEAGQVPTWSVQKSARNGLGGQELFDIAQFVHRDGELRFEWNSAAGAWGKPGSLQFSTLEVQTGPHQQICWLWRPVVVSPAQLNIDKVGTTIEVPIAGDLLDPPQRFRVQFELTHVPFQVTRPNVVGLGESATLVVGNNAERSVELRLKLVVGSLRCALQVAAFGRQPMMQQKIVRTELRELKLSDIESLQSRQPTLKAKSDKKRPNTVVGKDRSKIDDLQKQLEKAQEEVENLAKQMSSASSSQRRTYETQLQRAEARVEQLQGEIDQQKGMMDKKEALQHAQDEFASQQAAWCNDVLPILRALRDQAQLQYSLYVEGAPPVTVLRTAGIEPPAD